MDNQAFDALLTTVEAARLLRLSARSLERLRTTGAGPVFCTLGRAIRYRRRDLLDWIEGSARRSTSEPRR